MTQGGERSCTQGSSGLTSSTRSGSQHVQLCFPVCPSGSGVWCVPLRRALKTPGLQPRAPRARLLPAHALLGCKAWQERDERSIFTFFGGVTRCGSVWQSCGCPRSTRGVVAAAADLSLQVQGPPAPQSSCPGEGSPLPTPTTACPQLLPSDRSGVNAEGPPNLKGWRKQRPQFAYFWLFLFPPQRFLYVCPPPYFPFSSVEKFLLTMK